MAKRTVRPAVRKGRSTTKRAPAVKAAKKSDKGAEIPPAINDAAWMERLQEVQYELAEPKPPRPVCVGLLQPYVRRQIKKVLPALCDALLSRATEGDLSTMKLLWQMAELDRQTEPAGDGVKGRKFVRQAIAKYRNR